MADIQGYSEGEICNRNGCEGIIKEHEKESSCSCHLNPPCSHCTTSSEYCPVCEWDGQEEQNESQLAYHLNTETSKIFNEPKPVEDDGKLYDVVRYFDNVLEAVVKKGISKTEAYSLRREYNDAKPRCYVSYDIRESKLKP